MGKKEKRKEKKRLNVSGENVEHYKKIKNR